MSTPSYGLATRKKSDLWKLLVYLAFAFCLLVTASWWTTQVIAKAYGHHAALGAPLWGHTYAPWRWCVWLRMLPPSEAMDQAIAEGQAIFIFPQIVVLGFIFALHRRPRGRSDIHGSASWALEEDIQRMGFFGGKGVYVGGWLKHYQGTGRLMRFVQGLPEKAQVYLRHNGPEHILAFAPTRSGKGVCLVLTTLLSWLGSVLVLDIKGENWALTAGWRKSLGHKVIRFDPKDVTLTARFNPLQTIRLDQDEAVQDAQAVATILLDPQGKGLTEYFEKAAFAFFTAAVLHCLIIHRAQGRVATMYDFAIMLGDPEKDIDQLFEDMISTDHAAILGDSCRFAKQVHLNIASSAQEMRMKADKERSGVLSTAGVNLSIYKDPTVAYATSHSDFTIEDLMNHEVPVALYFVVSPSDIDRLRPLTRLIFNVILCRLNERMEFEDGRSVQRFRHRMLLMLDEFTSLGNLGIFERALAYMAGYGIKAYIIVQDIAQLQKAYTKEEAIISNCHIRIAFAPNKPETAKVLSEMTGKTTIVEQKTSLSGSRFGHLKSASISIQEVARPLLTPDECMRLPGMIKDAEGNVLDSGDMLVFVAGFAPVYGKQILYFRDPVFNKRAKVPPPPTDRLYGAEGVIPPMPQAKTLEVSAPAPTFPNSAATEEADAYEKALEAADAAEPTDVT